MNAVPGITLATHRFIIQDNGRSSAIAANSARDQKNHRFHETLPLGDWLIADLDTRNSRREAVASDSNGVTVLLDGYLTDIVGDSLLREQPARSILTLYRKEGMAFVSRLRGSYVALILDTHTQRGYLFNDRSGSRPVFYRVDNQGSLAISSEVRRLAQWSPALYDIDPAAVCEFLIFASYYNDHTLFSEIRKMPLGAIFTISTEGFAIDRYWRIQYQSIDQTDDDASLIEECESLLRQATRRRMQSCKAPFLFLSGGIDSRLILGSLLREKYKIPVACYGTCDGEDLPVATALARRFDLEMHKFPIDNQNPQADFLEISLCSDGRSEMIDTPSITHFINELSDLYGSYFQGDKCFGGKKLAETTGEAFSRIGIFSLLQVSQLADWLNRDLRNDVAQKISTTLDTMVADSGEDNTHSLTDHLYAEQRMGNRQNGYAATKLRCLEPARPFLDEDVVDFIAQLPARMRANKFILKALYEKCYPEMQTVPFSKKDSIPQPETYRKLIPVTPDLRNYIHEQLSNNLDPRLKTMFNPRKFNCFLDNVVTGRPFSPVQIHWWDRIPGMWRLNLHENRVAPIKLMLRLLQVNLYLSALLSGNVYSQQSKRKTC